jgi:hypothetical protein
VAWTAPMTAIAGSVFTAAQFNTFVRDNLAETAPAKATTPGSHFAVSATNQITERTASAATNTNAGQTTSTSFTDLDAPADPGPSVTVTTGSFALIYVHASVSNTGTGSARAAYDTSGATTLAAADNRGVGLSSSAGTAVLVASAVHFESNLNPGSNTFTMKYRVSASTGNFGSRRIGVIPF